MPSDVRSDPNEVVADIVGRNYLVAGHLVASDGGRQRDGIAKHSRSANRGTVLSGNAHIWRLKEDKKMTLDSY